MHPYTTESNWLCIMYSVATAGRQYVAMESFIITTIIS